MIITYYSLLNKTSNQNIYSCDFKKIHSLKEINQNRISHAQDSGSYVELVETITLDGRNASNIILENSDGNYSRFVSMFTDGELYVFKISGDSINSITSEDISNTINSADIA